MKHRYQKTWKDIHGRHGGYKPDDFVNNPDVILLHLSVTFTDLAAALEYYTYYFDKIMSEIHLSFKNKQQKDYEPCHYSIIVSSRSTSTYNIAVNSANYTFCHKVGNMLMYKETLWVTQSLNCYEQEFWNNIINAQKQNVYPWQLNQDTLGHQLLPEIK